MINIILCGCWGRMGEAVIRSVNGGAVSDCEARIVAGINIATPNEAPACSFPTYHSIFDFPGKADVIIDFSHHSALPSLAEYATKTGTPLVVATTGHTDEELDIMKKASESVAIFHSGNMSLGINLLTELCKMAQRTLGADFDIEIIEKHHNKKLDAPSGTALMIANAISEGKPDAEYVYDRHTERKARSQNEIGIHSVRGGTIVGEHEVIFAGMNEIITVSHSALSREIFANGAIRAANYIAAKGAGLYNMSDLINGR